MTDIFTRKADHVRACLTAESQFAHGPRGEATSSFDAIQLMPEALPEIALEDVDLTTPLLGKTLSAPILVSSMTGGPELGARINRHLAEAVEALQLGMGLGSQRIAIEHVEARPTFVVRPYAPTALVLANLGAVQLNYGYGAREARLAVELAEADGLFLHLNAIQEAVQEGGDTNFRGLHDKIRALVADVAFPVAVKECGAGIGPRTVERLFDAGVAFVDLSGAGGTSWAKVEGLRATSPLHRTLGDTYRNWGLPTPRAIVEARARCPRGVLVASGGIRSGLDAAKALALGADAVSIAQPVLAAAMDGTEAVIAVLQRFIAELRVACFAVGVRTPRALRDADVIA